jgi:alpha-L-fucosidase 2
MVGLLASVGVLAQFMMAPTASAAAAPTRVSVDYAAFLARSDLVWSWDGSGKRPVPFGWWGMGFTGNGLLGAMVTTGNTTSAADDLGTLLIEVGRSDILDDRMPGSEFAVGNGGRCDRVRLPIGYFVLKTEGKVKSGAMRLSLWDAEISGQLQTTKGAVNFTVLTHALKDLNVAHVVGEAGEAGKVSWQWNPRPGNSVWKQQCQEAAKRHNRNYTFNPPQVNGTKVHGSTTVPYTVQPLLSGASFATAYTTRAEADGSSTLLASTARPMTGARGGGDGTDSAMAAVANVQAGMVLGWNALRQSHRDWWNRFYPASFLSLSDSRTEAFYWAQMYKLASASRASKVAPTYGVYDHTGPWFTPSDTCCPLFNWCVFLAPQRYYYVPLLTVTAGLTPSACRDMNFPVEYQVVASSNHPEIGYSIHSLLADPVVYLDMAANAGWIETNSTAAVADSTACLPTCRRPPSTICGVPGRSCCLGCDSLARPSLCGWRR